jgi:hypothetical protein
MNLCECGPSKDRADVNNSHSLLEMRENIQTETAEYNEYKNKLCYVRRNIMSKTKPAEKQEVGTSRLLHKIKLYCRRKLTLNSW